MGVLLMTPLGCLASHQKPGTVMKWVGDEMPGRCTNTTRPNNLDCQGEEGPMPAMVCTSCNSTLVRYLTSLTQTTTPCNSCKAMICKSCKSPWATSDEFAFVVGKKSANGYDVKCILPDGVQQLQPEDLSDFAVLPNWAADSNLSEFTKTNVRKVLATIEGTPEHAAKVAAEKAAKEAAEKVNKFKANGKKFKAHIQKETIKNDKIMSAAGHAMSKKTNASTDAAVIATARTKVANASRNVRRKSRSATSLERRRLGWKPSHDMQRRREGFHHLFNPSIQESTRCQES